MKRFVSFILILSSILLSLEGQNGEAQGFYFTSAEDQVEELNREAKSLPSERAAEMLNLARKGYNLAEEENLKRLAIEAQALMGIAYYHLLEIDKSLESLKESYDMAIRYQYQSLQTYTAFHIGVVYRYLDEKEKALALFSEALELLSDDSGVQKVSILVQMAETYRDLREFGLASQFADKALSIAEELNLDLKVMELHLLSGNIAFNDGRLRDSVSQLIRIIGNTADGIDFSMVRASAMALLSRNYALLKDYTSALSYGQDALLLAVKTSNEKARLEAYSSLSFIYRQMNNYREAYNYLSLYYQQKEKYDKGRNDKNLNSIKTYYETLEKEKEIDEQKVQIDSQNRLILYGGLMLVLLLALLFVFYLLYKKKSRIVEKLSRDLKREMVLSKTDPVTGLPNRKGLDEKLKESFLKWKDSKKDFSLLIISLYDHKKMDKEVEPGTGEQFQKYIGDLLHTELKGNDFISLWKPFAFSILLPETDEDSVKTLKHKLDLVLNSRNFKSGDKEIPLSFKSASATYSGEGTARDFLDKCREQLKSSI